MEFEITPPYFMPRDKTVKVSIRFLKKANINDKEIADIPDNLDFQYGRGRWFCLIDEKDQVVRYYKILPFE